MRNQPIGGIPEPFEKISILSDSTKEGTVILLKNKKNHQEAVMKIFPIKKSVKAIEKEIKLQKKFYPLAPEIFCEGKNYFIMEKGIEVSEILQKTPKKINEFISDFFALLLHQLNLKLLHNDTKMDNIMYFKERGFLFIDFGFSKEVKDCQSLIKVFPFSLKKIHDSLLRLGFIKEEILPLKKLELEILNYLSSSTRLLNK